MKYPFASLLIADLAAEMGIRVELEPEFKFAGEIVFPSGRRHLFRNTNFNINPAASTEIAKDKSYCKYFLRKHGFPVPRGQTFFARKLARNLEPAQRRQLDDAIAYANGLGYPVFVKPNDGSQGELVAKIWNDRDLMEIGDAILQTCPVLLVEEFRPGRDFRIVVLGDDIISAYERLAFAVTGDGVHSIDALIAGAQDSLPSQGRPNSEILPDDVRIDLNLRSRGIDRSHVPAAGEHCPVLDNANLSTGGTSLDVTAALNPSFRDVAVAATRALGLKFAGVDLICEDVTAEASTQDWTILELNAAAGLDNYAAIGGEQARRVRDMYRKIIRFLENM